jgi:hypothetical protein
VLVPSEENVVYSIPKLHPGPQAVYENEKGSTALQVVCSSVFATWTLIVVVVLLIVVRTNGTCSSDDKQDLRAYARYYGITISLD